MVLGTPNTTWTVVFQNKVWQIFGHGIQCTVNLVGIAVCLCFLWQSVFSHGLTAQNGILPPTKRHGDSYILCHPSSRFNMRDTFSFLTSTGLIDSKWFVREKLGKPRLFSLFISFPGNLGKPRYSKKNTIPTRTCLGIGDLFLKISGTLCRRL